MQTPTESKQNCYFFSWDKRKEKPIKNKNKKPIKTRQKKSQISILSNWIIGYPTQKKGKKRKTRETHQLGYLQQQKVSVQERERKKNLREEEERVVACRRKKKKKKGCQNEKFDVESSQMNEKSPLKFD